MMNILVFGGTFNPVHNGHVRLCRLAAEKVNADKVIIVPTYSPVHKKTGKELASCQARLDMCRIAFENENCTVSDIEISAGRACYTYETLRSLRKIYPDAKFFLACGSDMFLSIHSWRRPDLIFKMATICAMSRSEEYEVLSKYAQEHKKDGMRSVLVESEPYIVSSTELRQMLADGEDISSLVPERVAEYIKNNGLYL